MPRSVARCSEPSSLSPDRTRRAKERPLVLRFAPRLARSVRVALCEPVVPNCWGRLGEGIAPSVRPKPIEAQQSEVHNL